MDFICAIIPNARLCPYMFSRDSASNGCSCADNESYDEVVAPFIVWMTSPTEVFQLGSCCGDAAVVA